MAMGRGLERSEGRDGRSRVGRDVLRASDVIVDELGTRCGRLFELVTSCS
jgi:hypothetical protein